MRIAVCLSGQPRFLSLCAPLVKKHLIDPNKADVFVHAWWDPNDVGKLYDTSQPHQAHLVGYVEEDVPSQLEKLSSIDQVMIEPPSFFEVSNRLIGAPTAKPNSICSNFYSQQASIRMKAEYEKANNFIYDAVIRARIDLWYDQDIKVDEISHDLDETLVLASIWQDIRQKYIPGLGGYTMDDNIAISRSKNIDKYGEVYSKIEDLNRKVNPPYAENYLGWNCKIDHGLKVETCDFKVDIMHRIVNNTPTVKL